ncbi:hypothetical protein MRI28_25590 [Nocardiopsis dassonvillei]|uniref:helix-turn-helix domain-containing protein n=1 Tax=Nocardiopsis dassonvillei TaxID=2014 RepID=UPI00200E60A2|nr:hypothetical protein [Nocardiopsis dassonvillei]MCK9872962.1 hypothetical protein [Nocardiopsis dassonvillei]
MRPVYEQGASIAQLAERTGWSRSAVRNQLVYAGTRIRTKGRARTPVPAPPPAAAAHTPKGPPRPVRGCPYAAAGAVLDRLRVRRGLSATDLVNAATITHGTLAAIRDGIRRPHPVPAERLLAVLRPTDHERRVMVLTWALDHRYRPLLQGPQPGHDSEELTVGVLHLGDAPGAAPRHSLEVFEAGIAPCTTVGPSLLAVYGATGWHTDGQRNARRAALALSQAIGRPFDIRLGPPGTGTALAYDATVWHLVCWTGDTAHSAGAHSARLARRDDPDLAVRWMCVHPDPTGAAPVLTAPCADPTLVALPFCDRDERWRALFTQGTAPAGGGEELASLSALDPSPFADTDAAPGPGLLVGARYTQVEGTHTRWAARPHAPTLVSTTLWFN